MIEPTSLDTLTIRAAAARRSSGSMALVTATTHFLRFTRSTVADLRAGYARYPGDPGIESLVTEMLALSGQFAEMWAGARGRGQAAQTVGG